MTHIDKSASPPLKRVKNSASREGSMISLSNHFRLAEMATEKYLVSVPNTGHTGKVTLDYLAVTEHAK